MTYRDLAEQAWSWVLGQVDDGPRLRDSPDGSVDSLYDGIAGLAPLLAELRLTRPWSPEEQRLADAVVTRLQERTAVRREACLYDGVAGDVVALRLLAPGTEAVALERLAELREPEGWPSTMGVEGGTHLNDVVMGTAGICMTQLWAGAPLDVTPLLEGADETAGGLDWRMFPGYRSSSPNFSHGTAGVAALLALVGHHDLAVRGAEHLLSVGRLDDRGFAVEHTFPRSTREVEPYTWGWCHGPAGLTYLFAALEHAGVGDVLGHDVRHLRARCLDAVFAAGVPRRLRPGFWDNDGRCCGTAGVGEAVLDTYQATGDDAHLDRARTLGEALAERAVVDDQGARWRFVEHRSEQPLLPPGSGWMQGAAGIAAFLLRLQRVLDHGRDALVVTRPDQWWAVPEAVRVAGP